MTISLAINNAIEALYHEYFHQPSLYIREANLQFRLNQLILDRLTIFNGGNLVYATIEPKIKNYAAPASIKVCQSQTELKLDKNQIDIIVFNNTKEENNILLTRHPPGPLDIIAKVDSQDVAVVIEMKAAPSANSSMPPKLVHDVNKLLSIKNNYPHIEAHFVYFDKTIGVAGYRSLKRAIPSTRWPAGSPPFRITSWKPWHTNFVHVWEIDTISKFKLTYAYI